MVIEVLRNTQPRSACRLQYRCDETACYQSYTRYRWAGMYSELYFERRGVNNIFYIKRIVAKKMF